MDVEKLIESAAPWTDGRWMDRVDQAASFLFLHGYISQSQREKVVKRLESQLRDGVEQGRIIVRQSTEHHQ